MTKLTRNLMRIGLLFSLCFSVLFGSCGILFGSCGILFGSCRYRDSKRSLVVGFEPNGTFHVGEVNIDEEGNEYDGKSYYQSYKKEHLYDFSYFTFDSEAKTVAVYKVYDDTQVIGGTFEYTAGKSVTSVSDESYKEYTPSKLTVSLENGDVFEGTTIRGGMLSGKSYIELSGNGIFIELTSGEYERDYFAEFHKITPKGMSELLGSTYIANDMNAYEDNRYPQAFRDFYQKFADRERLLIYPDGEYSSGYYNVALFASRVSDLPNFRFGVGIEGKSYYINLTYLPKDLDELDEDWVDKYKDGGQVWNEARTHVSFVTEYQDPYFAYSEILLVEIVYYGDEPITQEFIRDLKFSSIAVENTIEDCLTEEEISALDVRYREFKPTDGLYNGEKIDGYEILDDHIYMQTTQENGNTVRVYRLLEDDSVIATEILYGQGRFYYEGKFYTFDTYHEISRLYLHFYASENE